MEAGQRGRFANRAGMPQEDLGNPIDINPGKPVGQAAAGESKTIPAIERSSHLTQAPGEVASLSAELEASKLPLQNDPADRPRGGAGLIHFGNRSHGRRLFDQLCRNGGGSSRCDQHTAESYRSIPLDLYEDVVGPGKHHANQERSVSTGGQLTDRAASLILDGNRGATQELAVRAPNRALKRAGGDRLGKKLGWQYEEKKPRDGEA